MGELMVRRGKGDRGRVTMLPQLTRATLLAQLAQVEGLHQRDLARGQDGSGCRVRWRGRARPPSDPLAWQWVFPASRLSVLDAMGLRGRHHLHQSVATMVYTHVLNRGRLGCGARRSGGEARCEGAERDADVANWALGVAIGA